MNIDTGTEYLLARVEDGVATVTLNQPGRRNALSADMLAALGRVLSDAEDNDDIGAIVLTGAGGAFCSGGDVRGMADRMAGAQPSADAAILRQRKTHRNTTARLWGLAKPTIAALPGPAAGAGLAIALACDIRYAVQGTFVTTGFAKVGLTGENGGIWFLTQLVGPAKALELYYFSERIPVEEAERLGIVNAVFAPEAFDAKVTARARQLADGPRLAYRYMKENAHRSIRADLADELDLEVLHNKRAAASADHAEGVRAVLEKRPPVFGDR